MLNQTSQTIEKSFGKYWTKLTLPPDALNKARIVRYTYSPNALRRVFPEFPRATLTIDYRNDRVVEIQFFPDPLNQQAHILNKPNALSVSALVQEKQVESRFFQYVFGYRPPIYKPLSYTGGNFGEIFSNCLGDGVVSSYKIYAIAPKPTPIDFSLRYESVCSRPYDQIKFTQDLLGG